MMEAPSDSRSGRKRPIADDVDSPHITKLCGERGLPPQLRVLELFAGIGGWRVALDAAVARAGVTTEVVAYDSGPHCSEVYMNNFGDRCSRRNIEQLDISDLDGFDLWVMSPPCQPFSTTREAKQRDIEDKRCKALEHLCRVIPRLQRPPRWLALENVKGFRGSEACALLQDALASAGFTTWPLLLDLEQFGVPNHRTRFYLLAERSQRFVAAQTAPSPLDPSSGTARAVPHGGVLAQGGEWAIRIRADIEAAHQEARGAGLATVRDEAFDILRRRFAANLQALGAAQSAEVLQGDISRWKLLPLPHAVADAFVLVFDQQELAERFLTEASASKIGATSWSIAGCGATEGLLHRIGEFLEDQSALPESQREELVVSQTILQKPFAKGLSYVEPDGRQSFCFTGHYGKVLHKSSGSLLYVRKDKDAPMNREDPATAFGAVRFFSPKEIINLLGFPSSYQLPPDMALKHRYKVVGNSIAVIVCTELLEVLLLGKDDARLKLLQKDLP